MRYFLSAVIDILAIIHLLSNKIGVGLKITMIISAILLIYGAFSTIFHETSMVGKIGKIVGDTNISLFSRLFKVSRCKIRIAIQCLGGETGRHARLKIW